mmetsp:Transcript_4981/g.12895  ORF Transcript_4981/g.12895 Transcript_4981/m.12895 type:complete len:251 (+) Transcript_4981:176-928(+)
MWRIVGANIGAAAQRGAASSNAPPAICAASRPQHASAPACRCVFRRRPFVPAPGDHWIHRRRVHRAARNPPSVATAAGQAAGGGTLEGARLRLTLDIGRERNTWMPQTWAASGRRLEIPVAVEMQPGGIVMPLGVAAFIKLEVGPGEWRVEGGTLRFWLTIGELSRGDITLPAGRLYFSAPVWGGVVSRNKGIITIRARRWLVREESRMVGRLAVTTLRGDEEELGLGAIRLKAGGLDGPVYYRPESEEG